jgi:hypothetical protein
MLNEGLQQSNKMVWASLPYLCTTVTMYLMRSSMSTFGVEHSLEPCAHVVKQGQPVTVSLQAATFSNGLTSKVSTTVTGSPRYSSNQHPKLPTPPCFLGGDFLLQVRYQ